MGWVFRRDLLARGADLHRPGGFGLGDRIFCAPLKRSRHWARDFGGDGHRPPVPSWVGEYPSVANRDLQKVTGYLAAGTSSRSPQLTS